MSRAEKDLRGLLSALSKWKESPDEIILDILENLSNMPDSIFTLAVLKSTKCGKVVKDLKKNTTNAMVKAKAAKLLSTMKKAAKDQGYKKTDTSTSTSTTTTTTTTTTAAPSTNTTNNINTSTTVSSLSSSSSPSSSTTPTSSSLKPTGNDSRDRMQKKFFDLLKIPAGGEESEWPSEELFGPIAVEMERQVNSKAHIQQRPKEYLNIVKRLTFNLKQNGVIRSQVARGKLPPFALIMLDPQELATEDIKNKRQSAYEYDKGRRRSNWLQANKKEISEAAGMNKDSGVSMYTCPNCESRNIDSFAMQTRGADEPMTIFCTCLDCQTAFRGGNDQAGHD
jgi:transcription elongation factor S-II